MLGSNGQIAKKRKTAKHTLKGEGERVLDLMFDTRCPQEVTEWLVAPLESALARGDAGLARKLVQAGAKIGGDALYKAVRGGHTAVVELLLDNGASVRPYEDDDVYGTPLHDAAEGGNTEMAMLLLLNGADVDYVDCNHTTPLSRAIDGGHISMVETLLEAGADLNLRVNDFAMSALDMAALNQHAEIMRMLVDHGMDVNGASSGGTALHWAAEANKARAIDVLVGAGADIEAGDMSGSRPLHRAAAGDHNRRASPEASLALLQLGAEVNAQTEYGETALHNAAEVAGRPGSVQVVDLLLRWGADETIVSKQGEMAADMIGTRMGHRTVPGDEERVRSLLARAPAERAWRRRGLLVLCRVHPNRLQLGGDLAGLVSRVVQLEEVGVFRTIVRYL
ncbi:unnamed protein product [Ectocarpus fasciculatus]